MTLKSSSQIVIDADVYIPDNITEDISAGDVRDRIKDIADSMLNRQDGGLVLQAETGYSTPITPSTNYSFATKKYVDDGLAGVSPIWGSITGTVTDQTDLITYLGTNYQPLSTNLTSLSGLSYASASFVKMTASGTFSLDTNTYATTGSLSAYAKLDGSNTPFTGNIRIEPTSGTSLLLKGATSDNTTKALSVTDSSNVEYFYLRNDKTAWLNGSQLITGSGTANRVTFWNGTNTLSNNSNFTFNNSTGNFSVGASVAIENSRITSVASPTTDTLTNGLFVRLGSGTGSITFTTEQTAIKGYISVNTTAANFQNTNSILGYLYKNLVTTITTHHFFKSRLELDNGTITNLIHFGVDNAIVSGGTVTNNFVLRNPDGALVGTNKWFLYNDDNTVNSYLKGQLQLVGTSQNALVVTNGIKIGNNTDSAGTAGAGSIKYVSSTLQYSDGSNWITLPTSSGGAGGEVIYQKIGASLTAGVIINLNGIVPTYDSGKMFPSAKTIKEIQIIFGTHLASAASTVTVDIRKVNIATTGQGTAITGASGSSVDTVSYTTVGAVGASYYVNARKTGLSHSISAGDLVFCYLSTVNFATIDDIYVFVRYE